MCMIMEVSASQSPFLFLPPMHIFLKHNIHWLLWWHVGCRQMAWWPPYARPQSACACIWIDTLRLREMRFKKVIVCWTWKPDVTCQFPLALDCNVSLSAMHLGADQQGHFQAILKTRPAVLQDGHPMHWLITNDGQRAQPTWMAPDWFRSCANVFWLLRADCVHLHTSGLCFGLCFCASGFWACFCWYFPSFMIRSFPHLGTSCLHLTRSQESEKEREREREGEETSTTFWSISGFALPSVSSKSCLVFVLCFYSHVPPHAISFPYKMTGFLPRVCSFWILHLLAGSWIS